MRARGSKFSRSSTDLSQVAYPVLTGLWVREKIAEHPIAVSGICAVGESVSIS